jgi:S1-C subfamily serine protease
VLPIELSEAGPLGIHIEKRPDSATAVVQRVMAGSPAERAGLERSVSTRQSLCRDYFHMTPTVFIDRH